MSQRKKFLLFSIFILTILILLLLQNPRRKFDNNFIVETTNKIKYFNYNTTSSSEWRGLTHEEIDRLSNLGRMLFLDENQKAKTNNSFKILIWKYGPTMEARHLKRYSDKTYDPFEHCSVKNCEITYEDEDLTNADLVIFNLFRMSNGLQDLPSGSRNPNQIWAFLTDERPYNTFLQYKGELRDFDGIFNWSMTYSSLKTWAYSVVHEDRPIRTLWKHVNTSRMDSDIPVPYGRTILRDHAKQYTDRPWAHKKRDVLVTILGSNCNPKNKRWEYVKELQKHIKVDVYGKCGTLKCAGHYESDCPAISDYIFYLAFENANCDEYITEKVWWNAYAKNSIPVIMGAAKKSYNKTLPPNSYIDVDDFPRPADLAKYLLQINKTETFYDFYTWKNYFEVFNEHGFFKTRSFYYCRACEALNYNNKKTKVYTNLKDFWSVEKNCRPAWDEITIQ